MTSCRKCLIKMNTNKINSLLGLALRARKLAIGASAVEAGLRKDSIYMILLAEDAGSAIGRKIRALLEQTSTECPVLPYLAKRELGVMLNRTEVAVLGVLDKSFASGIRTYFDAV